MLNLYLCLRSAPFFLCRSWAFWEPGAEPVIHCVISTLNYGAGQQESGINYVITTDYGNKPRNYGVPVLTHTIGHKRGTKNLHTIKREQHWQSRNTDSIPTNRRNVMHQSSDVPHVSECPGTRLKPEHITLKMHISPRAYVSQRPVQSDILNDHSRHGHGTEPDSTSERDRACHTLAVGVAIIAPPPPGAWSRDKYEIVAAFKETTKNGGPEQQSGARLTSAPTIPTSQKGLKVGPRRQIHENM
ncbi:hypothetical protein C8R45DRAFT_935182 [Mycena sanguinolenta]|nr:hypothetical protein C8R45DRAFT_935182 [Mycena sanguinolenta]